jgi:HTH-type transcriptional regulator / antitoxin MqsA
MSICDECGQDAVKNLSSEEAYNYKGQEYSVEVEYSYCEACKTETIEMPQILANEKRVRIEKKKIDGLLSSGEIRASRKSHGLTQEQCGILFGGGQNGFSKYERSEVTQSAAMDKLMRLAFGFKDIFNRLVDLSPLGDKFKFSLDDWVVIPIKDQPANDWENNKFNIETAQQVPVNQAA